MPFVEMPGLPGKVYVPERQEESFKKHPCKIVFYPKKLRMPNISREINAFLKILRKPIIVLLRTTIRIIE